MQEEEHPDIKYIKTPEIGKIIAQGLAAVYLEKPNFPIDFLAKWLLNHCHNQAHEQVLQDQLENREKIVQKQVYREEYKAKKVAQAKEVAEKAKEQHEAFLQKISQHKYKDELLKEEFAEYIQKYKNLTGVYIGHHELPSKPVGDDDNGFLDHLDDKSNKVLTYISTSKNHEFMQGKMLKDTQGVTFKLFGKGGEQQGEDAGEDAGEDQEAEKQEESTYHYVPDIVRNKSMHYFRIPKLGSYLAIPLVYQNCLQPAYFDNALKDKQDVIAKQKEQDEQREVLEEEKQAELEALEDDEDANDIEVKYADQLAEMEKFEEKPFEFEEKEYVVCMDTMGQDRQITEQDRKDLEHLVKYFQENWSETEKKALEENLQSQLEYLSTIDEEKGLDGVLEEIADREEQEIGEKINQLDEPTELEEQYETLAAKCLTQKDYLFQEESYYKKSFEVIKTFRVLCHTDILQLVLYFLGYTKEEINIKGTNLLNWKQVRLQILNEENFWQKIDAYDFQGPKGKPKSYQMINHLLKEVAGIQESSPQREVDQYNLGYGRLYAWFQYALETRVKDILVRRAQKKELREIRQNAIEEHELWDENRKAALEEALRIHNEDVQERHEAQKEEEERLEQERVQADLDNSNLDEEPEEEEEEEDEEKKEEGEKKEGEEGEQEEQEEERDPDVFDEEGWFNEYKEDQQEPEIPPEVVDDIDEDWVEDE